MKSNSPFPLGNTGTQLSLVVCPSNRVCALPCRSPLHCSTHLRSAGAAQPSSKVKPAWGRWGAAQHQQPSKPLSGSQMVPRLVGSQWKGALCSVSGFNFEHSGRFVSQEVMRAQCELVFIFSLFVQIATSEHTFFLTRWEMSETH